MSLSSRTHKVEIDGKTIHIRKFEPFYGIQVLGNLQTVFFIPLAKAMEVRGATDTGAATETMAGALRELSKNLDGAGLLSLVKTMVDERYMSIEVDGQLVRLNEGQINIHFDDPSALIELVVEAVMYNFSGFITRFKNLSLSLRQKLGQFNPLMAAGSSPPVNSGMT